MISDKKATPKIKQILGVIISFVLTIVFLYLAFKGVDFSKVFQIISHISWFWTLFLTMTLLLSHFVRAVRWKFILNSVKNDTSILNLYGALMVGYGVNCAIPRLGEISRAVLLGKWEGLSRTSMLGTIIVERVIDSIALVIALGISVVIYNGDLYKGFPWLKSTLYLIMFLMLGAVLFIILVIEFKEKFSRVIVKIAGKFSNKLGTKLAYIFEMLIDGFASLKGIKNYLITIILTAIIMTLYAVNSYIGFYTLYLNDIKTVTFSMGWILMSISAIGVVIPTPGGTGSYHALAKSVLVLLFGFGVEIGAAYAILTHAISYFVAIISAIILYYWVNYRYTKHMGHNKIVNLNENKA